MAHRHVSLEKLSTLEIGELWGGLRRAWKGFTIARAQGDTKNMKNYAEAIDKFKQELAARKQKDKRNHPLTAPATRFPPRIPKYTDGLLLRHDGKLLAFAPIKILKHK